MATVFGCYQVNTGESRGKRSQREEKSKTIDTQSVTCLHTEIHPRPPRGEIQFPHHFHQAGAGRRSFVNGRWKKMQMQMKAKHCYCFSLDCVSLAYSSSFARQIDKETVSFFSSLFLLLLFSQLIGCRCFFSLFCFFFWQGHRWSLIIHFGKSFCCCCCTFWLLASIFKKPDCLN